MQRYKYPRIKHFPFSQHITTDDKRATKKEINTWFDNKEIIVTEKMDGENSNLYRDYIHARTTGYSDHPSRHWLKGLWGQIKYNIPEGWRICGENVFAEHSIHYLNLSSYFLVFNIFNADNVCISWDETVDMTENLGLSTVPVLFRGKWNEDEVQKCYKGFSTFTGSYDVKSFNIHNMRMPAQEGYVARISDSIQFPKKVENQRDIFEGIAKFVRKNHVTTDEHWLNKPIVKNELKDAANS